jgi:hypothetical protein
MSVGHAIPFLADPSLGYNSIIALRRGGCPMLGRSREVGRQKEAAMSEKPGNGPAVGAIPDHQNGEREDPVAEIAQEIATYRSRLPELLAHEGQFVLIKGDQVIGFFGDASAAIREGYRRFGLVPLLVKRITAIEPVVYIPNVVL